jgi:hypothetical protein
MNQLDKYRTKNRERFIEGGGGGVVEELGFAFFKCQLFERGEFCVCVSPLWWRTATFLFLVDKNSKINIMMRVLMRDNRDIVLTGPSYN